MEEFKIIPGFNNYSGNRNGQIKNILTGKILNYSSNGDGYIRVALKNEDGKVKYLRVHRIIAELFIENSDPTKYTIVDHIDRNRSNNCVTNLRWATPCENQQNTTKRANTYGKYKGINFSKNEHKWTARITIHGKRKYIGAFNSEEDAFEARSKFILDNKITFAEDNKITFAEDNKFLQEKLSQAEEKIKQLEKQLLLLTSPPSNKQKTLKEYFGKK